MSNNNMSDYSNYSDNSDSEISYSFNHYCCKCKDVNTFTQTNDYGAFCDKCGHEYCEKCDEHDENPS